MSKEQEESSVWVGNIVPWSGWCDTDYCKLCKKGSFTTTFEFHYKIGGKEKYVTEACGECTKKLVDQDKDYTSIEFWKQCKLVGNNTYDKYLSYGIIDDFHLDDTVVTKK